MDAVRSCHDRYPRTTGAVVPVLPSPGVLDDTTTIGLRRLRREYAIHRVMRQFDLFQEAPVPVAPRLPPTAHM
jgi:hypothetical protein